MSRKTLLAINEVVENELAAALRSLKRSAPVAAAQNRSSQHVRMAEEAVAKCQALWRFEQGV